MASGLIGANNPTASLGEAGEEDALVPEMPLKIEELKKGGWEIIIVPDDYKQVQKIFLTVFENASATLQVTSQSRSPISYSGNLVTLKKK